MGCAGMTGLFCPDHPLARLAWKQTYAIGVNRAAMLALAPASCAGASFGRNDR